MDERAHFIKAHNEYLTPPSTYMDEGEEAEVTVTYHAWRAKMGDGTWSVGIEKLDTEREDPDPWGNGPIIVYTVVSGSKPDRDFDTQGLAATFRLKDGPPFETEGALNKAKRIAERLNSGDLTLDRLTSLIKGA